MSLMTIGGIMSDLSRGDLSREEFPDLKREKKPHAEVL